MNRQQFTLANTADINMILADPTELNKLLQNLKPLKYNATVPPEMPYYLLPSHIKIPKIPLTDLINLLEETLSIKMPKLELISKKNFTYTMELNPIDGLKIKPVEYYKKMDLNCAAVTKAYSMLPSLVTLDSDLFLDISSLWSLNSWCKIEINIFYDFKNNSYILEVKRIAGEGCLIYSYIFNPLKAAFSKENMLWTMRRSYISLLEGIQVHEEDPIREYLLDESVCRETCSYYDIPLDERPKLLRR